MGDRPRLLDLFSGAGGAGMGYHRAGFDVTGVDIKPRPRYPFAFVQADALAYLAAHGREYDAIHASPPCQGYSSLRHIHDNEYPDLIAATRAALVATGLPYVIENVPRSPLVGATVLCGSMFGLGAVCRDGAFHQLRRHRLFESNLPLLAPPCRHAGRPVGVYGHGGGDPTRAHRAGVRGYTGTLGECAEAMGIDWMLRSELSQSIPPAYTQHLGAQLLAAVSVERAS